MSLNKVRLFYSLTKKTASVNRISNNYFSTLIVNTNLVFKQQTRILTLNKLFSECRTTPTANFDEVKAAKNNPNVLLIDVREPQELQETGSIPGSINIPLGELENVLKNMPPEEFKNRYGRTKPDHDFEIITSCKVGRRSAQAQEIALKLGFRNVKNYLGSWQEWEERNK